MSDPHRPSQWPPPPSRPGETEWIPRVQDEPFQFREEAPQATPPNQTLVWGLRALGLVTIAVISGLVWAYIRSDSGGGGGTAGGQTTVVPEGRFDLTAHPDTPRPVVEPDCAKRSYGKEVQPFLQKNKCVSLAQSAYTTKVEGGREVLVSVSVVRMPTAELALQLEQLTEKTGTGNISDLVKAGIVKSPGLTRLTDNGGYDSKVADRDVVICEGDFTTNSKQYKNDEKAHKLLDEVCEDAVRKGAEIAEASFA